MAINPVSVSLTPCPTSNPLIGFDTAGAANAPKLGYNVPERSAFTCYGTIPLPVSLAWNPAANTIPGLPASPPPSSNVFTALDTNQFRVANTDFGVASLASAQMTFGSTVQVLPAAANHRVYRQAARSVNLFQSQANLNALSANISAALVSTEVDPYSVVRFDGSIEILNASRPTTAKPTLFIIEEYKTVAFYGNFGAGQTVGNFTLLPGEQTEITIKTYREIATLSKTSSNVVDSYSSESAKEFEGLVEDESSEKVAMSATASVSGGFGGASASASFSASRESNARSLSKALNKQLNKSNASRQINVSQSTEKNELSKDETITVRKLENPNKSRVLNFVFRQLIQEYHIITYLDDIKLCFSNGHPDTVKTYSLQDTDKFLSTHITPASIDANRTTLLAAILAQYANITDAYGTSVPFVEQIGTGTTAFLRKRIAIAQDVRVGTPATIVPGLPKVPGPIINYETQSLRTPAVIVDALLGQSDALDCYAKQLQELDVQRTLVEVTKLNQEIESRNVANEIEIVKKTAISTLSGMITAGTLSPADGAAAIQRILYPPASCPPAAQSSGSQNPPQQ